MDLRDYETVSSMFVSTRRPCLRREGKQFASSGAFKSAAVLKNAVATVKSIGVSLPICTYHPNQTESSGERSTHYSYHYPIMTRPAERKAVMPSSAMHPKTDYPFELPF
jgi:hypothetical protein